MTVLFIGTPELILIVIIVMLLFGGKRIPELMRGLGNGIKSFKDGMNGITDDVTKLDSNASKEEKKEQK